MPLESPRIADLRRRVEADPASIAFAQLAEEYRRSGNYQAAEECCRAGLQRHPEYLSARVTLGRTLIELGKLEDAEVELRSVLKGAPDNLAAIRGLAEIHERRGNLESALEYYRRALPLARHDPELEETVSQINRELGGGTTRPAASGLSMEQAASEILSAVSRMASAFAPSAAPGASADRPDLEAPIDFDALLRSLSGGAFSAPPPMVEALLTEPEPVVVRPEPVLPELPVEAASDDRFAALERGLRDFDTPAYASPDPASPVTPKWPEGDEGGSFGEAGSAYPSVEPAPPATPRWPESHEGGSFGEAGVPADTGTEVMEPIDSEPAAPAVSPSEQAVLDELEAWLAAIKR